jgi:hypothetical protein
MAGGDLACMTSAGAPWQRHRAQLHSRAGLGSPVIGRAVQGGCWGAGGLLGGAGGGPVYGCKITGKGICSAGAVLPSRWLSRCKRAGETGWPARPAGCGRWAASSALAGWLAGWGVQIGS